MAFGFHPGGCSQRVSESIGSGIELVPSREKTTYPPPPTSIPLTSHYSHLPRHVSLKSTTTSSRYPKTRVSLASAQNIQQCHFAREAK
ncbi:hypothetical protein BJ508DRAFT_415325 [Ascobolus immersus RN42]|uniref:Uncharacterized protein n=1 Tax=Ascobolus immersus RN42 TaxID=1160509 RepID=A0A3N4I3I3_ASCIM|nr:hypothetical protein BJ508DRAFT_415325 [Ascobolus immersus RN42]